MISASSNRPIVEPDNSVSRNEVLLPMHANARAGDDGHTARDGVTTPDDAVEVRRVMAALPGGSLRRVCRVLSFPRAWPWKRAVKTAAPPKQGLEWTPRAELVSFEEILRFF